MNFGISYARSNFYVFHFSVPQHAVLECKHGSYGASSRVLAAPVARKLANRARSNDVTWNRARKKCKWRTSRQKVKKKTYIFLGLLIFFKI